jgi:hypothetical protein
MGKEDHVSSGNLSRLFAYSDLFDKDFRFAIVNVMFG